MVTLVLGVAPTPDAAFDLFRSARRALRNAVDYRRRETGIEQAGWRAFGLAGTLELDAFEAEDFARLGSQKQAQYRALGLSSEQAMGPVWVVTAHLLVHAGSLGEAAVHALFEGVTPMVHTQDLHAGKSLMENAERVVGYAAKLKLETTLVNGETRRWPLETVALFVSACMRCSHGRQGFKLAIQPRKTSSLGISQSSEVHSQPIEPMPVVF